MNPQVIKIKRYSIDLVQSSPDTLFIYGDNLIGRGKLGQAIIRDEINAFGIPTKKLPATTFDSYFNDKEYDKNIEHIQAAVDRISHDFKYIAFPEDGLGTGLADLPNKAPKTYEFLIKVLNDRFDNVYGEL